VIEQENFSNPEQVALETYVELPADQAALNTLQGLSLIILYISATLTAVCMLGQHLPYLCHSLDQNWGVLLYHQYIIVAPSLNGRWPEMNRKKGVVSYIAD
jgi:hypothetical protein